MTVNRIYSFDESTNSLFLVLEHFEGFSKKHWMRPIFMQFLVKDNTNIAFGAAINSDGEVKVMFQGTSPIFGSKKVIINSNKFTCTAFDWHFDKFLGYVIAVKRKLIVVSGLPKDILAKYAPRFKYIEDNEHFVEDEEFYDNIELELSKKGRKEVDKGKLRKLFRKTKENKKVFCELKLAKDALAEESQTDVESVFGCFKKKIMVKKI